MKVTLMPEVEGRAEAHSGIAQGIADHLLDRVTATLSIQHDHSQAGSAADGELDPEATGTVQMPGFRHGCEPSAPSSIPGQHRGGDQSVRHGRHSPGARQAAHAIHRIRHSGPSASFLYGFGSFEMRFAGNGSRSRARPVGLAASILV
jgi:hypothetical protein